MRFQPITPPELKQFNKVVLHPLQSYEWGEFRERTGVKVIRRGQYDKDKLVGGFTMTVHRIPHLPYNVGYVPKSNLPDKRMIEELKEIGKKERCLFIQLEPNERHTPGVEQKLYSLGLRQAARPLFTKYTFVLDLQKTEDELMKSFHSKTRYNIRVAQRHNVTVSERTTDEAFETYLRLTAETTKRQEFFAHSQTYHQIQWEVLPHEATPPYNQLSSHLLLANYNKKTLAAWILFVFRDTLYYPYGSSSSEHRETMSSNLIMWEAIKFGKRLGLKYFDMWGALGPDPDTLDPWYGFHRFKQGYRPEHVEFVGSYDIVIHPALYKPFTSADKLRWLLLKLKKSFS